MFGWGKNKTGSPDRDSKESGEPLIAVLLMAGNSFPTGVLKRQLARTKVGGRKPSDIREENGILSFELGDELVAAALLPGPYPWSDLEGPCATSWMWPKEVPAISLKAHRTHVLITLIRGKSPPIERRLLLTSITAMAAGLPEVMGVYWGEATLVHYPPVFIKMAEAIKSAEAPPLYLWVDFRLFRTKEGGMGLFTTGLRALGRMEMEIPDIAMDPGELRDWAMHLAYYFIEKGPSIKDGDTIGVSAEHRLRIRHRPSLFGHPGKVIRLEE